MKENSKMENYTEFFKSLRQKTNETKYERLLNALKLNCEQAIKEGKFVANFQIDETNCNSYFHKADGTQISMTDRERLDKIKLELNQLVRFMQAHYNMNAGLYFHDGDVYKDKTYFLISLYWYDQISEKKRSQIVKIENIE